MKTFIAEIIPKIKKFSQKIDEIALLTNKHWVVIDELKNSKLVYIFRSNSQLLISKNGRVEKGSWEYLGNNSILITNKEESYLFKLGFFDSNVMALKVDGINEYAFLVNENNYRDELNTIENILGLLENKYIRLLPSELKNNNENIEIELPALRRDLNVVRDEEGMYGYVNRLGDTIIDFKFDGAFEFSEGVAMVYNRIGLREKYGFIDKNGNTIIPLTYDFAESFNEGLALVRLNNKFGFINQNGKVQIEIKYNSAESFENGKAKVKLGSNYFKVDKFGNEIKNDPY